MFYPLDENTAVEYIRSSPLMDSTFKGVEDLQARDLAEGNINLIFRVYSASDPLGKSVLIKQAMGHARKYPAFKMPQDRARLEAEMLDLENKYAPGLAPRHYFYDPEMHLNIMEDLNRHIIMRVGLMRQVRYPKFAEHIGTFLARTLFYTSDFYLTAAEKKAMVPRFINPVMCKVTEDLVFTEPFMEHPNNHWTPQLTPQIRDIHANKRMRTQALEMKHAFMANAEALIHGDLHTGSLMVNADETRAIDPEFGFFGPMGFDIGAVLGNLLLSHASQEYHAKDPQERAAYRQWLLDSIRDVWNVFAAEFGRLWDEERNDQWPDSNYKQSFLLKLLRDSAGFGACKAIRRIIGIAHVPDMWEIPDDPSRAVCESMALNAAQSWLLHHHVIHSIDEMVEMVHQARPGSYLST